ncbi:hypothetical protein RM697_10835 [Ichthyenterobacterium sp. W332]|uniref:Uncharacterized protein n=1 Tax=Microcosmobacter mediterraneus TaxID=3075607 RepID=A0ABU2YLW2_9FLAO|nr:hypothetical protein [Ichthyenterobacterium sp. W332]MDT0559148.1 hypothetical protein [Ichthyenterobacterium sp. W332]
MKTLYTLIALMHIVTLNAQNTYLKITKSNKANDYVMYPPGTKFELKTKEGYIIFKNSDNPGVIEIDEAYTLYVYPNWKDDSDIYKLSEGKLEKILTSSYYKTDLKRHITKLNKITAEYTVTDSKKREGKKNLKFKLSNGITFEFNDSKYRAYLYEEENYLNIEGKYLIESELGTLKLSFNTSNGIVWWVFED